MKKRSLVARLLLGVGVVALVAGVGRSLLMKEPHIPPVDESASIITYSTDTPDEIKPGVDYRWRGAAADPKKLRIEKLNVDAFVQQVGVDQNRQIAVPNNIHMAGWFVDTVRPGEKGLSIVDGHVNGRVSPDAVFSRLNTLVRGDIVSISFGDNSTRKFELVELIEAPTAEITDVLFSQRSGIEKQLNLITCAGHYDEAARQYENRIVAIFSAL